MTTNRRAFLKTSVTTGAAMAFLPHPFFAAPHPLNILILGGTSFLGPHLIRYAMQRGHSISIFTRGQTEPTMHRSLFHDVERLVGDRANDLEVLRGRRWDAVIDNSGRRAGWTRDSAMLLRDNVDLYLYTSSTGVYYPYLGSNIGETTDLVMEVPEGIKEDQQAEYGYGVMKANSEKEARQAFGDDRTIVVRPTYIMGPGDRTNRFTYWPVRLHRGGEILVPGNPTDPVQYIDVRDLTEWMIRLIEDRNTGVFNAVGPSSATGMQAFIHGAHAAFSSPASFVSVPDYEFLIGHEIYAVVPWIMPRGNNAGSALVDNTTAMANGLSLTPLAQSVGDIHQWWNSDMVTDERRSSMVDRAGSLMAREASILEAWKARGK